MTEREGSREPSDFWIDVLNSEYLYNPRATADALDFIAALHEETTGSFLSVDKRDENC